MKVIDLHCDTLSELRHGLYRGEKIDLGSNHLQVDLEKLKKGDYLLQCFALFINLGDPYNPLVTALEQVDLFRQAMRQYPQEIRQVTTWEEFLENRKEGRISALLTVEEGGCCLGNLSVLRVLYSLGVRIMTLTWNYENDLAWPNEVPGTAANVYPCAANTTNGLKEKGLEFFSPMRHEERTEKPGTSAWAHKLFEMDRAAIEDADALVVLYYGNYSDTGTAWECGYAFAKGKPVILVYVDADADSNLMMHCGCRANISLQDLKDYDFDTMPKSEYEGKML